MADPIKLLPCPFCEGPPVPIVQAGHANGWLALQDDYGDAGADAYAFVFCHECGTEGPHARTYLVYDRADYLALETEAVRLWNQRDARHRKLYDGGDANGLNLYPRQDEPR